MAPTPSPERPRSWADVASSVLLEVLSPAPQAALRSRRIQEWVAPGGQPCASFHRRRSGYLVRFPDIADFEVSARGQRVRCRPVPGIARAAVEQLYATQVLPLAMGCAGRLVFHASAVDLEGRGVAFMGASGRGKSTLAAAFARTGCRFISDDGLLLEPGDELILPSSPSLRLWEDSRRALLAGARGLRGPHAKARCFAGRTLPHCAEPRPLHAVYFLGEGRSRSTAIEPVSRAEALVELVRHSFMIDVEGAKPLAEHFARLAALARDGAFFRLDYPRRFDRLPEVREAVARHARARPAGRAKAT